MRNQKTNQIQFSKNKKTQYQIVQEILQEIKRRQRIVEAHNKAIALMANKAGEIVFSN
jgi:hypothetical protein